MNPTRALETRDSTPSNMPRPARRTGQTATFFPEMRANGCTSSGVSMSTSSVGSSFVAAEVRSSVPSSTCFRIAGTDAFREYQQQIRTNADTLAATLQEGGLDVLTGGTDTHLLQVDLRSTDWTGKDAEERLAEVKLTVNRNTVPFDERPPTVASGIRIGTPAATMRGFDEDDFREIGQIIVGALGDGDVAALAARTEKLCEERPLYPGFRGFTTYVA